MLNDLLYRLRAIFHRNTVDHEVDEELQWHLEQEAGKLQRSGLSREEAERQARLALGGMQQVKEECREAHGAGLWDVAQQDLRYGLRQLAHNPGFTTVAILSLALGIGANTGIFQLLNAVRLRSLPVQNPRELVEIRFKGGFPGFGIVASEYAQLTRPIWQELRREHPAFSGVFAWSPGEPPVGERNEKRVKALWVSGGFFSVLGIQPERGRLFTPAGEAQSCPVPQVVVSHSYWQRELGGVDLSSNPKMIIDRKLYDVIGVTPAGFFGMIVGEQYDVALPLCQPKQLAPNVFIMVVMGRLRPGWTEERASAYLASISPGIMEATCPTGYASDALKRYRNSRLVATQASAGVSALRRTYDTSLWMLLAITGLVLLIACANLANLMLARASVREREMAVRMALGAGRARLIRQLISESLLLAMAGAGLGIAVAQALTRVLVWSISSERSEVHLPMGMDWPVLLFAASVGVLTCLIFGVLPALRATRVQPISVMNAVGRGLTTSRERFSLQRLMMITQIATSLVLLTGAFLFARSFRNLLTFDPGMREGGITVAILNFGESRIPPEMRREFKRQLLEEVQSAPGLLGVATTTTIPLYGSLWGHEVHVGANHSFAAFTWVSPGYFETMRIPLLSGRGVNQTDSEKSGRVAVVNQAFIRKFIGSANPIGITLRTDPEPDFPSTIYEIVGVIPDTQHESLRGAAQPAVFAPALQNPADGVFVAMMIHSDLGLASTIATVRRRLAEKHPEILIEFNDFQAHIQNGMLRERLLAMLSGFFGILAAVLAMVGLYGLISYIVARRRNEIAIRIALGARPRTVIHMVMREAAKLLAIGLAIGLAVSLIAGRSAGSLLFGLKPYDPATLVGASVFLAIIAALASFLPAWRAAQLDPSAALRE